MPRITTLQAFIFAILLLAAPFDVLAHDHTTGVLSEEEISLTARADESDLDEDDANDPLEPLNRAIFSFNEVLLHDILGPVAGFYNDTVPVTGRAAVSNLFDHLASPITFVNDLLQLEFERALTTLARFVVNTTGGMGGIADFASEIGLEKHKEDFGQTLGSYGVGEGFYLVLPVLGPSNPRDAVGRLFVDRFFDPLGLYLDNVEKDAWRWGRIVGGGFVEFADVVDELEQIRSTSVDYYAAMRSLYRQRRASEIANGELLDLPPIPDFSPQFSEELEPPVPGPSASIEGASAN